MRRSLPCQRPPDALVSPEVACLSVELSSQIPARSGLNSSRQCVRLASAHQGSPKELTFLSQKNSGRKMSEVAQIGKELPISLQVSLTSWLPADLLAPPVSYFPTHQMMLFAAWALRRKILTFQNRPNTLKVLHVPAALCFFFQ